MATPASRMLRLLPLLVLLAMVLAATADEEQQLPITLPGCPDKCGDVSIPYPFGIKANCFLPGFEVVCNETLTPPRPFLAADEPISNGTTATRPYMMASNYYYEPQRPLQLINESLSPVELMDISVSQGQLRVHGAFSFDCRINQTYHSTRVQLVYLPMATSFLVSQERNVLLVIGRKVEASMPVPLDCGTTLGVRTAGRCLGKGWCQGDIQVNTRGSKVEIKPGANYIDWPTSPCSYGMVVDNSWYNFSEQDLDGDSFLRRNEERGVPIVLHFTIKDIECPAEGEPPPVGYACVSNNSECIDGPILPSHYCNCSDGFHGNPYIPDGCKGVIGGLFLMAVLAFYVLLRREKRKMRDFFEKNGGPTLEKVENIKIYKKEDLKPILKSTNIVGHGGFGEVYKGLLDNTLVAVKKPISSGNVAHNEQFANEVIIQSQVNHRNIVRLKGCCLEVDIPMLVYEFLPNGSLHDILHSNDKVPLDLDRRLSIAAESADGLAYMHSKANHKILHGDVKPANILLDDNFIPKISDFGISRLIATDKQHTNYVIGDMTYMDPVYLQSGLLTDKSDVYSFGVVLLELICRKKATHKDNNSIIRDFLQAHKTDNRANELFDKEVAIASNMEHLNCVAVIAVECLNLDVNQRPHMTDVAERLLVLKRSLRRE
ncbi:wall-associated receptor kinase 1-like isoform X2 [Phragmites australis]|uniref:wall-associated receptor kinase 1-like isoform X2 n=1 Tax=Phragmites australis TaxID=29695 RepID=UPI002D78BA2C|nr:wall-associated receptor kinase 1-like isoform X2 [Phragmites australis]